MTNKPTAIINLVQDTHRENQDGTPKNIWHRIGAVFKNKSGNGSVIVWDFEPIPTNGRMYIMPYQERQGNKDHADKAEIE